MNQYLWILLAVPTTTQIEETSGAALLNGGIPVLKKHLEKLEQGGVLFLDEAYQLNPATNPMGAQVSPEILACMIYLNLIQKGVLPHRGKDWVLSTIACWS